MKNKNLRGIVALAVVTALSFGVILGSKALTTGTNGTVASEDKVLEELDTKGAENIEKAVKTENGYMVTVKTKGYGGDIVMNVSFDKDAKKVTKVEVVEQSETEGLGAKIAEAEFLDQFNGVEAPVFLPGMSLEEDNSLEGATFKDGTYTAKTEEYDDNGFIDELTMTVKDGKITEVVWDCINENGDKKSVLSETGKYVMTEDGPTWKEQAEALGAAVVEKQSTEGIANEAGKTDTVSGVSIYIGGFVNLAEQCMKEAAGVKEAVVLADGTYEAKTTEPDKSGYIDELTLTVKDGKVTEVVWDCVDKDGNKKSVLSENGQYVMTEDGPTWKEQAEALAAAVVANQNTEALGMKEDGKTDSVSGVSIYIGGFVGLVEDCLGQAAGAEAPAAPQNGTEVDAVSGATISSTAAVTGINNAFKFLQSVK